MPNNIPVDVQLSSSYPLAPSKMEDIDYALYNYLNEELNISCNSADGFNKVPVIFSIPERSFQIKNNESLRTAKGNTLKYPLISLNRTSVVKNPTNKGRYGVYVPPLYDYYKKGGSIDIARMVQQTRTAKFANANAIRRSSSGIDPNYQTFPGENKNIVYETISIPMPTFVEVSYTVSLVANYQQQMNDLISPFLTRESTPSVFSIEHEGNRYEAFMLPDFSNESNSSALDTSERVFRTTININVLGYLVGADKNQETPNVVIRQSAAKIQMQRERAILGDIPDFHPGLHDKYRPS
jgi:hypothetical protein